MIKVLQDKDLTPITICMNPRFTSQGVRAFVLEDVTKYTADIYSSDYQNYINQTTTTYPNLANIRDSKVSALKINKPKILVCVCIYNEQSQAIKITMNGIYKNLEHLERLDIKPQDIAVVLIQDGILKCHPSVVNMYEEFDRKRGDLKCHLRQRIQVIKDQIENAKMFGKMPGVGKNGDFPQTIPKRLSLLYQNLWRPDGIPQIEPALTLFTCFKHVNGKKLSSQAWFFEGFCRYLKPQFCILLDVGTVPDEMGVFNLINGLMYDKNIGGVSGFMGIDSEFQSLQGGVEQTKDEASCLQKTWDWFANKLYSVERAQQVEYIYAHFLDKNFESFIGFLHVLPGAWSGYRLSALQNDQSYAPDILQMKYFKTLINPDVQEGQDAYKLANMYLAEDRILSLAIYCQPQKQFYLKYIPNARAKTDPMKSHYDLITQRRRWINSSLFAFEYVWANYGFDMRLSKHNAWDYLKMNLGMVIAVTNAVNAYLIPAFYLFLLWATLAQNKLIKQNVSPYAAKYSALVFTTFYVFTLLACIAGSLNGNRWIKQIYQVQPDGSVRKDARGLPVKLAQPLNGPAIHISRIISFLTYLLMGLVLQIVIDMIISYLDPKSVKTLIDQVLVYTLLVTVSGQLLIILMHVPTHPREVWSYLVGWLSYVSYQGAYTHTMTIFSFCNVDDVSWGTKGATDNTGQKKFQTKKMFFVSTWLLINAMVCFVLFFFQYLLQKQNPNESTVTVLLVLAVYSGFTFAIKALLAFINHLKFFVCCCFGQRGKHQVTQRCTCCRKPSRYSHDQTIVELRNRDP